ncbi:DUF5362 family protein [Yeosuana marina]|uniref:DUF5362 family protein n=1 Tax=Yeosuana marina TaxID=1565536 RepID=UPI0030EDB149|tara:strand:+ start:4030 stop:4485 length:456 start_codon:yes stop_codon:yes gene_type:complete
MEEKSVFESFELEVKDEIKGYLSEISKWSYFLSIMGFIGVGLMVLAGIFIGFFSGLNNLAGSSNTLYNLGYSMGIGLFYIVLALIYLFPVIYLFRFSKRVKSALKLNSNEDFRIAFLNLKSHYKFMGIFVIVIISIYVLILIGAMGTAFFN